MSTVLIIEDDQEIAELQRDYLEAAGFSVEIETDGTKGLERALSSTFDLTVVDLMLPGTDGFSICKELRSKRDSPIMVVSARTEDIDKIRALGIGVDDYVSKPFSPAELVARAKAHIARYERLSGGEEDKTIVIGALTIDTESKSVTFGDRLVSLTATEFSILELLARHPKRVFTRREIFERVWGETTYGDVSTVTVHIRRLRAKLEPDPNKPQCITTVWGMGYRISA